MSDAEFSFATCILCCRLPTAEKTLKSCIDRAAIYPNLASISQQMLNRHSSMKAVASTFEKTIKPNCEIKSNRSMMNASQLAAVEIALSNSLSLIQGPPGTGKTTTAVELIRSWIK